MNSNQTDLLQDAIKKENLELVQKTIDQGVNPKLLYLSSVRDLHSTEILEVLIENGFNLHMEKNKIITEWMGSSITGGWRNSHPPKLELLSFIATYYLKKSQELEKFSSLADKTLFFRLGLEDNNFNMMKFAYMIGANKNEALNSALHKYYSQKHYMKKNNEVNYAIIEYILNSDIQFDRITISNAVFFQYNDVLHALDTRADLEYGYEMAYSYNNDALCEYFDNRGVSKDIQNFIKMKISAIKGDIKELRKAQNCGADLNMLDSKIIVEVLNGNKVETLKYLYDSGISIDYSIHESFEQAMNQYNAYESITFLVEQGLDITKIKNMPLEYKEKYPIISDMWEKGFSDIFDYTIYLSTEIYPKLDLKEKEKILQRISELSSLSYVIKKSKGKLV